MRPPSHPLVRWSVCVLALGAFACAPEDGSQIGPDAESQRAVWTDPKRLAARAPAGAEAPSVLAVVVDEPINGHVSTVAAFFDGTAGLYTSAGTLIEPSREVTPAPIRDAALRLCAAAAGLAPVFADSHAPLWPRRGRVRITVVTRDGTFSRDESQTEMVEGGALLAALSDDYLKLLRSLFELKRAGFGR